MAAFSEELARRLGVPLLGLYRPRGGTPLFSLKASEMSSSDIDQVMDTVESVSPFYGVFWHDDGVPEITADATHVFYADPSLGSPGLWCPSLLQPRPRTIRLFSFGMAGRLQADRFNKVRELLKDAGLRFALRVSVGLHEGTTLDDAERHFDLLRDVMGRESVTILGCLSDDAVSEELANADYVLAFFDKGVRANNTTVHAALDAGCRVITNHDDQTPAPMRMSTQSIDLLTHWPAFNKTPMAVYSWDNLIQELERICEASRSTAAK